MSVKSVKVVVTGRVQGVWFRGSTRDRAQALGLTGCAHNREDGAVEVTAHGAPDAVDAMVAWLHRGPHLARVDSIEIETLETGVVPDAFMVS